MRPSKFLKCSDFPCSDVNKEAYMIPGVEIEPEKIRAVMISESPPENTGDYFYARNNPSYMQTTV